MRTLKRLWDERNVLTLLVRRDLRVRYAQSVLGYLWTVIDPLANALIYFMIFVVIFQRADAGYHPYFLFLLSGLLPWQWFNASVSESMRALIAERQLIRSTKLPRQIWVIRVVASKGIEFIYSLPVLVLFTAGYLLVGEVSIDWELLYWPLAIALQFVLLVGIGLIVAPLTVLLYDIQPTVRIILRVWFYMTPIIFNLELLDRTPEALRWVFQVNPLTGILELYRAGFFDASPRWPVVGISVLVTMLVVLGGAILFQRMERPVLKEL
ncbi:MAG: ABC transporter permease [Arachnia sp.]